MSAISVDEIEVKFDGSQSTLPMEHTMIVDSNIEPIELPRRWSTYRSIIFYCAITAFGGFNMGYDTGIISGVVNMSDFIERFGELSIDGTTIVLSDIRTGLILSLFNIGCIFGSLILSKLGDSHGRRCGIVVASIFYILGCIIQITSFTAWYQFMIGRILTGVAVGACTVLCPMLIAELSPKQIKGNTVFGYQLNVVFGLLIGSCISYKTKTYTSANQWRIPVACGIAWGVILIIGMVFMPESPQYLINKNKIDQAQASIAKCYNLPINDPGVNNEVVAIQEEVALLKASGSASWKEIIYGHPKILLRVVIGMTLQILNQLSGVNYFFYFGVRIFREVGIDSYLTTIILGTTNVVGTIVGVYIVERLGRRVCLLGGAIGMAICFLIFTTIGSFGFYIQGQSGATNDAAGCGLIFVANLFIFIYAATFGGCIYTVIAVLYPLNIRTKAISLASVQLFLWAFVIGMSTSAITSKINFYFGFVFFGCLLFAISFIYFLVPETKGLGFEDVDEMYRQNIPAWRSSSWKPTAKVFVEEIIIITETKQDKNYP